MREEDGRRTEGEWRRSGAWRRACDRRRPGGRGRRAPGPSPLPAFSAGPCGSSGEEGRYVKPSQPIHATVEALEHPSPLHAQREVYRDRGGSQEGRKGEGGKEGGEEDPICYQKGPERGNRGAPQLQHGVKRDLVLRVRRHAPSSLLSFLPRLVYQDSKDLKKIRSMAVDKWEPGCRCSAKLRRVRAEGRMMRGLADDGDGTDTPDNSRSLTGLLVSHDGDCPPSEASAQRVIWRWVNAATTPEHSPRHELGGHAEAGRVPILTGSGGHRSQMDLGGPAARPDSPSSVEVARARAAVAGGGPSRQAELGGHGTDERNMSPDVAGAYPPGSMGGGMGTSPDLRSEEGVWTRPVSTPDLPSDEEADGRDGAHGKGDGDVELSLHGAGQRGVEQGDPGGRQHCAVESPQRTRDALQEDPRGYRGGAEGQDSGAVGRSTGGSWHGEGVDSAGERGLGHASGDGEAGAAKSERIQSQAQDQYEVKEDPQASGAAERLVSVDDVLLLESDESVCNLGEVASAEACIDAQSYKGTAGSRRVEDTPCGGSEHPSAARMHSGGADAPPPRVSSPTNSLSSPHKPFIESGRSGHTQNPTDNDFASPCVDIKAHKPRSVPCISPLVPGEHACCGSSEQHVCSCHCLVTVSD